MAAAVGELIEGGFEVSAVAEELGLGEVGLDAMLEDAGLSEEAVGNIQRVNNIANSIAQGRFLPEVIENLEAEYPQLKQIAQGIGIVKTTKEIGKGLFNTIKKGFKRGRDALDWFGSGHSAAKSAGVKRYRGGRTASLDNIRHRLREPMGGHTLHGHAKRERIMDHHDSINPAIMFRKRSYKQPPVLNNVVVPTHDFNHGYPRRNTFGFDRLSNGEVLSRFPMNIGEGVSRGDIQNTGKSAVQSYPHQSSNPATDFKFSATL